MQDLAYKKAIDKLDALSSDHFFVEAAKQLAVAVDTRYVMFTEHPPLPITKLKTLSFWDTDQIKDNFEFMPDNTPCGGSDCGRWSLPSFC